MSKRKPLNEQTIVITGASSGIGLATARMAARKGANVVLSSRNAEALEEVADQLNQQGYRALAVVADVRSFEDLERLADQACAEFGSIDTWVNNAGGSVFGKILEIPEEEEREIFETNFWGIRNGCRVAVPALVAGGGGVLINLGSEVSNRSIPLQGMYAASKHAVKAYTDALRMELEEAKTAVDVCLIRPAGIDTPFTEHAVNRLQSGEPSLPDPVYHPDAVAEAILECAVEPRRDVFVGGASKFFSLMESFFPRATDLFMEHSIFDKQAQGSLKPHTKENEGLLTAPAREGQMRGGHKGKVHANSLYTKASLHPAKVFAVAGLALAFVGGFKKMMEKEDEWRSNKAA